MTIKLSKAQDSLLSDAIRAHQRFITGRDSEWWYPSRFESSDPYGSVSTAKALCGKGLLEFKTTYDNSGKAHLLFRISQSGIEYKTNVGKS